MCRRATSMDCACVAGSPRGAKEVHRTTASGGRWRRERTTSGMGGDCCVVALEFTLELIVGSDVERRSDISDFVFPFVARHGLEQFLAKARRVVVAAVGVAHARDDGPQQERGQLADGRNRHKRRSHPRHRRHPRQALTAQRPRSRSRRKGRYTYWRLWLLWCVPYFRESRTPDASPTTRTSQPAENQRPVRPQPRVSEPLTPTSTAHCAT